MRPTRGTQDAPVIGRLPGLDLCGQVIVVNLIRTHCDGLIQAHPASRKASVTV